MLTRLNYRKAKTPLRLEGLGEAVKINKRYETNQFSTF